MKVWCAVAGVGAGLLLAAVSFGLFNAFGMWWEFAAVLALLLGLFAGVAVNGILRHRNTELEELSAVDRQMWTPREFERDLSPHSAWTHEPRPTPRGKRGRR